MVKLRLGIAVVSVATGGASGGMTVGMALGAVVVVARLPHFQIAFTFRGRHVSVGGVCWCCCT